MKPQRFRNSVRWIHLALSAVLGAYVYSPWGANPAFQGLVQWLAFPLLAVTGVALWKQGWIQKNLLRSSTLARPTTAGTES